MPLNTDESISTGSVLTCANSTVRVTAVVTAASSTNTVVPRSTAASTSRALARRSMPDAAPAATATWTHAIATAGAAVPARISASVISPEHSRLNTSSSRRATIAVTRL
jgi:hypothetical protein